MNENTTQGKICENLQVYQKNSLFSERKMKHLTQECDTLHRKKNIDTQKIIYLLEE